MNDWRPLEEVGDIAYADYLVEHGIPADDEMIARLRARARPPKKEERLTDVIARELKARGWKRAPSEGATASRPSGSTRAARPRSRCTTRWSSRSCGRSGNGRYRA
jgi:hypothetical protein